MEKKMENEMETGFTWGCIRMILNHYHHHGLEFIA